MPILLLLCFAGFISAAGPVTPAPPALDTVAAPLTVSADWLAQHLNDASLVMIHTGDREGYEAGHIPGAVYLPLDEIATPVTADPRL